MFKNHEFVIEEKKLNEVGNFLKRPWVSKRINKHQCKIYFDTYNFKDWKNTFKVLSI